jgi:hypothetical protein
MELLLDNNPKKELSNYNKYALNITCLLMQYKGFFTAS